MARLSLCMIAKNEEALLQGCLDSVKGIVDEVIIVDTGSTDATKKIAAAAGARVIDQPWNDDFAAPRNAALKAATGDWVLQLDADERLTPKACAELKRAIKRGGFACGMLRLHDADTLDAAFADVVSGKARIASPIFLPRLLKKTADLEYRGIVHEGVTDWLMRQPAGVSYLEADIVHLGNVPALRAGRGKSRRNIELLEKRCATEPDTMIPHGYLALELLKAGERERAWEIVEQGWKIALTRPKHQTVLRLADARATLQLQRGDVAGVLATVRHARDIEGPQLDLWLLEGCALELAGMRCKPGTRAAARLLNQALECFGEALKPEADEIHGQFMEGVGGWSCHLHCGNTLLALGKPAEAKTSLEKALALKPGAFEAKVSLAEALLDVGDANAALGACDGTLGDEPDGWLIAAAAAIELGAPADAQHLFNNACARQAKGYVSPHRAVRHTDLVCLMSAMLGRPIAGPGLTGALTGMLSRVAMPLPSAPRSSETNAEYVRPLVTLLRALMASNQAHLLEAFFEPRAEATFPGIVAELAKYGIAAEGQRDPVVIEVPNVWAERWLAACENPRFVMKRNDSGVIRAAGIEVKWSAVLADPVVNVRRLMAALGEAHDEVLIRHMVNNYPGVER
ncbi:MAG: glycosyltransferase [Myxococcaceae bacterium]|nr:glycosyltransferase [Myxococcaceae bacterium]